MIVYRLTSLCPGALQLGTVLVSPIPCCQGSVALPFVYWVVVGGSASALGFGSPLGWLSLTAPLVPACPWLMQVTDLEKKTDSHFAILP